MERLLKLAITLLAIAAAVVPVVAASHSSLFPAINLNIVAGINLVGWSLFLASRMARYELQVKVRDALHDLGLTTISRSLDSLVDLVVREVRRKNEALRIELVERRITNEKELSGTLQRIATLAYSLLEAESSELALFDTDSGFYHSSFVVGKPFRTNAQAMLSGAAKGGGFEGSPDVIVQPLAFSGTVLGTLRVALQKGRLPSTGDQEIMRLLALQGGIALINAQYNEELLKLKRASDESTRAKTGFLANLSHEIRGPLGLMLNAVELVVDGLCGPVGEEQLEALRLVRENGAHLLELVNDVLDYAKAESGKVTPNRIEIRVDEILKDLVSVVRVQADAKQHKVKIIQAQEALAISCDRRHLRQMLINLLTNAIKYTPEGGRIEVWAERVPGNRVRLNVKDSGIGINEEDRSRVFEAFERLNHSYALNQVGTGLGMSLTKKLAALNGGTIDFHSTPGQGSQFFLVFPAADPADVIEAAALPATTVAGHGEAVLLVQLPSAEQDVCARYLKHHGFKVIIAQSRKDAVVSVQSEPPKVVILDNSAFDLPEDDFLAHLRGAAARATLPVVLLTSRAFTFDIEKYLSAGVDRCLVKPVPLKELAGTCRELIDEATRGKSSPPGHPVDGGRSGSLLKRIQKTSPDEVIH